MNQIQELLSLSPASLDAGLIFSGTTTGKSVQGYASSCSFTPSQNPNYIFHDSSRDIIVWLTQDKPEPLYIYGPTGSGKTSLIKQLASKINYPVFEVTGHGRLEFADLVGHLTVKDGNMSFEYGPLSLAMLYGGIFLFNEIDLTNPEVAAGLNSVLDGESLCIAENGGEIIKPSSMFKFIATANTNGASDETGLYQGTLRQNAAFMDRFTLCELDYPKPEVEQELLSKSFDLPKEIITKMVDFANEVRKLFTGQNEGIALEITLSTRTLIRWADLTVRYQALAKQGIAPISYALDRALAFRASKESRAMLHELVQRMFNPQSEQVKYTILDANMISNYTSFQPNTKNPNPTLFLESDSQKVLNKKKFWKATVTNLDVQLHWGRMGTNGSNQVIALSDCINNNPALEAHRRASKKISEGYVINQILTKLN